MTIPEPQTIPDAHGNPAFVQLPAEEWAAFVRGGTAHEYALALDVIACKPHC